METLYTMDLSSGSSREATLHQHTARTVLFIDLDNTVLSNPFEGAVFPRVTGRISDATGIPSDQIKEMLLRENEWRMRHIIDPPLAFDWDDIARTVAKRLGVGFDLSIEQLVEEYARPPYISILENADIGLRRVKKPHRLMIVATNGLSKYQMPVLHALGIDKLFDGFLAPDLTNALKGHRDFYGSILGEAELAISVGDMYEDDIVGPQKLGMHTVLVARSVEARSTKLSPFERAEHFDLVMDKPIHPDAIIPDLEELSSVVSTIEQQNL